MVSYLARLWSIHNPRLRPRKATYSWQCKTVLHVYESSVPMNLEKLSVMVVLAVIMHLPREDGVPQSGSCDARVSAWLWSVQLTRSVEWQIGNPGKNSKELTTNQQSSPSRIIDGSGLTPGRMGFVYAEATAMMLVRIVISKESPRMMIIFVRPIRRNYPAAITQIQKSTKFLYRHDIHFQYLIAQFSQTPGPANGSPRAFSARCASRPRKILWEQLHALFRTAIAESQLFQMLYSNLLVIRE